jgi:hypothetical protein
MANHEGGGATPYLHRSQPKRGRGDCTPGQFVCPSIDGVDKVYQKLNNIISTITAQ